MSLLDTINAARKEAEDGGVLPSSSPAEKNQDNESPSTVGFTKKSVTRAKPTREAAGSVRVVSASEARSGNTTGKTEAEMSKEEKKALRKARRSREDRVMTATNVILKQNPNYKSSQRTWLILLGTGMACTIGSFVVTRFYPEAQMNFETIPGIAIVCLIVAAYALVITAFIHDWRTVRPMRTAAQEMAAGMTEKKLAAVLSGDLKEVSSEVATKAAAKAARKAKRNDRHEQHK